jgi:hypothetical protein
LESNIQPNQIGVDTIQQEITKLITTEQDRITTSVGTMLALSETDKQHIYDQYDQLLARLSTDESLTSPIKEQQLAFSTTLFNVDNATEKAITNLENPYKILLDNRADAVNGILYDLENHPNAQLLDDATYQTTKHTLTTLQNQIAGFYQRIQPSQQTTLQTKSTSETP